jgi:hypothetical protein
VSQNGSSWQSLSTKEKIMNVRESKAIVEVASVLEDYLSASPFPAVAIDILMRLL